MSVIKQTIYKCDVCEKETLSKDIVIKHSLPVRDMGSDGRYICNSTHDIDLCPECFKKFCETTFSYFADIENVNGDIVVKRSY